MTQIGTVIDGKYEILREIGRGGMSVVYLAMDTRLNKQWAVKEIRKRGSTKKDEIVVNSLMAEADMMKRLDHPALPRIVDIIDTGVTIYVVMDYIEGESLDRVLRDEGPQPEERVLDWAKQLCDVLGYLHGQKKPIIYRDMKPGNVMLKPEGNIKIIDFGIAREYKEHSTQDTTVLGTKGYAPPEQYTGQTDARSDIFALGVTMHQLLTGVVPQPNEVLIPVRQWDHNLSEGIEAIINKCVEFSPADRYQNCAELMYDLQHPELVGRNHKRKQKRRMAAFLSALVLSAATLIGGFAFDAAATAVNNSNYETLVNTTSSDLTTRIDSYKLAIDIYPEDTRAYSKMIEAYLEAEKFGETEKAQFAYLYDRHSGKFDKSSVEYAQLNYEIATACLNYYKVFEAEGDVDKIAGGFKERTTVALKYLEANHSNAEQSPEFENAQLSEFYYELCDMYRTYFGGGFNSIQEADRDSYEHMLSTIEEMMRSGDIKEKHDQLLLYSTALRLVSATVYELEDAGIPADRVQRLLDSVCSAAEDLTVNQPRSQDLQKEVSRDSEEVRKMIQNAYGLEGGN